VKSLIDRFEIVLFCVSVSSEKTATR